MIGDNIWELFKIRNIKRRGILYILYIVNMIIGSFLLNKYYPIFRFSSIWIIYIISEMLVVFLSVFAIEKGIRMFSRGEVDD